MEPVTAQILDQFFLRLGQRYRRPARLFLLGGSALNLLGSPRTTLDIDIDVELPEERLVELLLAIEPLAQEMKLDVEFVPLAEFAPLPLDAATRHKPVGRYGQIELFIFDPYSIALSKIARGFESDLEDVIFLLDSKVIEFEALKSRFEDVLPLAHGKDVDPREFRAYFSEIAQRFGVD